ERPFQPGRKARPAPPTQAGGFHFIDDPVAALVDDRLGAIPGAAAARTIEAPILEAVEILEDTVLVVEHDVNFLGSTMGRRRANTHHVVSFNVVGPPMGAEN